MEKIKTKLKVMKAVRRLLNDKTDTAGFIVINDRDRIVTRIGGKAIETMATMAQVAEEEPTRTVRGMLYAVVEALRKRESEKVSGGGNGIQEQRTEEQ